MEHAAQPHRYEELKERLYTEDAMSGRLRLCPEEVAQEVSSIVVREAGIGGEGDKKDAFVATKKTQTRL